MSDGQTHERVGGLLIVTTVCLIAGNLLGAGILGLPINTGLAGVIPAFAGMVVVCAAMYFSAVILAREATEQRKDDFNYPSLYSQYTGRFGKWVAIFANMLILYGLLTAYITGATSIVVHLFHLDAWETPVMVIVALLLSALTAANLSVIQKYNALLMIILAATFAILVGYGFEVLEPRRLVYTDWWYLPAAVPIIVTSFHFHNIIPSICQNLKWNGRAIRRAMLAGMLLGFLMNGLWIIVGVGGLPLSQGPDSLYTAYMKNIPATVPLGDVEHSAFFTLCAMLFALVAITTSFLANGVGLLGFITDLNDNILKRSSRPLVLLMTFLPPAAISVIYPDIFLKAINVVGGVGIVTLFGILPAIIALKKPGTVTRRLALPMLILFSLFLLLEIGQETGWLNIKPHIKVNPEAESWKHNLESVPRQDH